jgi:hypothetical protein
VHLGKWAEFAKLGYGWRRNRWAGSRQKTVNKPDTPCFAGVFIIKVMKIMSLATLAEVSHTLTPPSTERSMGSVSGVVVPRTGRFEQEQEALNLRNARIGVWFVMILVPLCSFLDWMAYPERYWEFLVLRLACAAGHVRKFVFRGFGYVLVWGCFFD